MATMLDVQDINVYYGAIHAVKGISFRVEEGEIVTLIGANGAGKTTTLQTVSGLLRSRTGSISFMGEDMWTTYGETTKQSVVESLENMILMEQHMEEYNVKITDEEKGKITEAAKLFVESNDAKAVKAMNATAQNTERMLTLFTVEAFHSLD